ncbi:MAG: hypothetical protein JHC93_04740 [Parachlamydiales bacterium]|nr:hypothetical protein [Parachlamydiales bacterium]
MPDSLPTDLSFLGPIQEPFEKLLKLLNIEHDGTLKCIVEKTQQQWLRPKGTERWDMVETVFENQPQILMCLQQMGFVDTIYPTSTNYDCLLIHGASKQNLVERILHLETLIKQGIRWKNAIFITGCPIASAEITELLEQFEPFDLKFIISNAHKDNTRANTKDTIMAWLETNPEPQSILALSNQPFVPYQHVALRQEISPDFKLETVGKSPPKSVPLSVYLDTVARWLYLQFC